MPYVDRSRWAPGWYVHDANRTGESEWETCYELPEPGYYEQCAKEADTAILRAAFTSLVATHPLRHGRPL